MVVRPIAPTRRMTTPGSHFAALPCTPRLREVVTSKLILDWSPKQISAWLKTEYPKGEGMRVSHETIYRSLFIQARGVLKRAAGP